MRKVIGDMNLVIYFLYNKTERVSKRSVILTRTIRKVATKRVAQVEMKWK